MSHRERRSGDHMHEKGRSDVKENEKDKGTKEREYFGENSVFCSFFASLYFEDRLIIFVFVGCFIFVCNDGGV